MNKKFAALGALAGIVTAGATAGHAQAGVLAAPQTQGFMLDTNTTYEYSIGGAEVGTSGTQDTSLAFDLFDPDEGTLLGVEISIQFEGDHSVGANELAFPIANEGLFFNEQEADLEVSLGSGPLATFSAADVQLSCSGPDRPVCNSTTLADLSDSGTFNGLPLMDFIGVSGPGAPGTFDIDLAINTQIFSSVLPGMVGDVIFQANVIGEVSVQYEYEPNDVQVSEPASLALLGLGLAGIGAVRRRNR